MNNDKKYLFDLMGYVIIENALTPEEVDRCNAAIDHHIDQLKERENSLVGESKALAGTSHRKDLGGMLALVKSNLKVLYLNLLNVIHKRKELDLS